MFQTEVIDKVETHFVFNNPPPENRTVNEIMWKKQLQSGAGHMTIWRTRIACWIPKAANTHSLCNTHCFSTARMIARTRLNVRVYVQRPSSLTFISCCLLHPPLRARNRTKNLGSQRVTMNLSSSMWRSSVDTSYQCYQCYRSYQCFRAGRGGVAHLRHQGIILRCNVGQWHTQEFCSGGGGGGSTNSVDDRGQRERGSGSGSPLVRGSGGSGNLVQEISFHIVKFS